MRFDKADLSQKIKKLKNVVPVKTHKPALQGILVQDGCLTASNMELAVRVRTGGADGESFIIPANAFDLINNLPDGGIEIAAGQSGDAHIITIKAAKIKNKYQVMDPSLFPLPNADIPDEGAFTIDSGVFYKCLRHVSYAIAAAPANAAMSALCLHAEDGMLNFVGMDGHVLAWDKVVFEGGFKLLIPKAAVNKLLDIGISGEVSIRHSKTSAVFTTDEYEVYTRIVEGDYFRYQMMFKELRLHTVISKVDLLDAMTRAKMCTEERCPVKFILNGSSLNLSIKDKMTDYDETLDLQEEMSEPLTIAFDARLVLETLKAFDCDNVGISFDGPKLPMIVEAEDSDFNAVVLPVAIY